MNTVMTFRGPSCVIIYFIKILDVERGRYEKEGSGAAGAPEYAACNMHTYFVPKQVYRTISL